MDTLTWYCTNSTIDTDYNHTILLDNQGKTRGYNISAQLDTATNPRMSVNSLINNGVLTVSASVFPDSNATFVFLPLIDT